jgi:formamidopyrimidine-DNA glycosylase
MEEILSLAGRAQLKSVLRDQRVIAGIGNAYSDEILHAAKLSPFKQAGGSVRASSKGVEGLQTRQPSGSWTHGSALRGVWCHHRRSELRRLLIAVLPRLPDRR